jgi:hypothetical protein
MVVPVVEHQGANEGDTRNREEDLATARGRPDGVGLSVIEASQPTACNLKTTLQLTWQVNVGFRTWAFEVNLGEVNAAGLEDTGKIAWDTSHMKGQLAQTHGSRMGSPLEPITRDALEDAERRICLLVDFSPESLQCRLHGMPPFSHVRPTPRSAAALHLPCAVRCISLFGGSETLCFGRHTGT